MPHCRPLRQNFSFFEAKGGQNPCPTLGENIATSSIRNIIHDFDFRSTSPLRLFTVDFSVFDHAAPKLTVCHFCLVLIDIFLMVSSVRKWQNLSDLKSENA